MIKSQNHINNPDIVKSLKIFRAVLPPNRIFPDSDSSITHFRIKANDYFIFSLRKENPPDFTFQRNCDKRFCACSIYQKPASGLPLKNQKSETFFLLLS